MGVAPIEKTPDSADASDASATPMTLTTDFSMISFHPTDTTVG